MQKCEQLLHTRLASFETTDNLFNYSCFVYKILNNQAPKYVDTCLNLYRVAQKITEQSIF